MDRVNLLELLESQESFHVFSIVINIACNISLDRSVWYLSDESFAVVLEENIKGFVELEAFFNRDLVDNNLVLSEVLLVKLELFEVIMAQKWALVAKDLLFLDFSESIRVVLTASGISSTSENVVDPLRGHGALALAL